jgi:hypothetical protein
MNLEIKNEYADEILQNLYNAGYLGFGIDYIVDALGVDERTIRKEFSQKKGKHYDPWSKGNLTAQTELRATVMNAALNASTPAIVRMLEYFTKTENEIRQNDEQNSIDEL